MSYLISVLVFLVVFSLLILIHEFGHFIAARKFGVKVEEFGMGLPPRAKKLWKDKHETVYSLNWIPFGGFVRMYGEDSGDAKLEHSSGSFPSKSVGARTVIILGGVLMNFLLGYVILVGLFTAGTKPFILTREDFDHYRAQGLIEAIDQVRVTDFLDDSSGKSAGLEKGDLLLSVNDRQILRSQDMIEETQRFPNETVRLTVRRADETLMLEPTVSASGKLGIVISEFPEITSIQEVSYAFPKALLVSASESVRLSYLTMKMFVNVLFDLFTKAELSPEVSGPVGIAQLTHQTTQTGSIAEVLKLIALLSLSLGAINVLPIPALDGGRFLSIAFEVATRRRPNALWEARIHAFGFFLLLILIVAITYQDIVRLFS